MFFTYSNDIRPIKIRLYNLLPNNSIYPFANPLTVEPKGK